MQSLHHIGNTSNMAAVNIVDRMTHCNLQCICRLTVSWNYVLFNWF